MHPFNLPLSRIVTLQHPVTCPPTSSIGAAIDLMNEKKIGCVIVTKDQKPVGIFTERDVLRRIVGKNIDVTKETIEGYMSTKLVALKVDDEVGRAMVLMRVGNFRHIPLISNEGLLQKVVSLKDLVDFMVSRFELKYTK